MGRVSSGASLRESVAAGRLLKGSFVKVSGPSTIEIMGATGFDFVVIDQEHGAFDRGATDIALLAAKAAALAAVVRVPSLSKDAIASALDSGATGILAPHIASARDARELVAACRYRSGSRGFSGMTRAGDYGARAMWDHVDRSDASIAVVAMIEDPAALSVIGEIASVDGLDALFIGRGDLTVAFGAPSREDPRVVAAVDEILRAARSARKAVWMMVENAQEARHYVEKGVTAFIISSDQGLLRKACLQATADFNSLMK